MNITQLINALADYDGDIRVIVFDAETGEPEDITGFLFDPDKRTLEICTDDNS